MEKLATQEMIEKYLVATKNAVGTLFRAGLYSHSLVILYSTIDTCGLLDAAPPQAFASGASFRAWVKKYILKEPGVEFNEIDLWGARCAVLHTFTSESNLSKAGKARELLYYTGDTSTADTQQLISIVKSQRQGKYLPVHYGDLCTAFYHALGKFASDLNANCCSNEAYNARLCKILQLYAYAPAISPTVLSNCK